MSAIRHKTYCTGPDEYEHRGTRGDTLRRCRGCDRFTVVDTARPAPMPEDDEDAPSEPPRTVQHAPDCRGADERHKGRADGALVIRCQSCRAAVVIPDAPPLRPFGFVCRLHYEPVRPNGKGCPQCDGFQIRGRAVRLKRRRAREIEREADHE